MKRSIFLDVARGICLVSMFFFHGYYDLVYIFAKLPLGMSPSLWQMWQQSIVLGFILISGAASYYAKHLVRRGIYLNLWGLALTIGTAVFLPRETIIFGVLNFLGTAMLLVALISFCLPCLEQNKARLAALAFLSLSGFSLTQGLAQGYLGAYGFVLSRLETVYTGMGAFIVGLPTQGIISADYVPLVPHFFVFLLGRVLWQYKLISLPEAEPSLGAGGRHLALLGRHSLIFYLSHQLFLYGLFSLLT